MDQGATRAVDLPEVALAKGGINGTMQIRPALFGDLLHCASLATTSRRFTTHIPYDNRPLESWTTTGLRRLLHGW
jgi:hypothetical protein